MTIDEMDEDLVWALEGKHALMEREEDLWKPLLVAAKNYLEWGSDMKKDNLRKAIIACEGEA